jgi:hypothetical protein
MAWHRRGGAQVEAFGNHQWVWNLHKISAETKSGFHQNLEEVSSPLEKTGTL